MLCTLRFQLYNRYPQPHYLPPGTDTLVDGMPTYEQSEAYRLRLVGSTDDTATWPEFGVRATSQVEQQATVVEVFIVLLSEYKPAISS